MQSAQTGRPATFPLSAIMACNVATRRKGKVQGSENSRWAHEVAAGGIFPQLWRAPTITSKSLYIRAVQLT